LAKSTRTSKADAQLEQLLRFGGAKIPAGLAAKSIPAMKSLLKKRLPAPNDLRSQGLKLYSALQGAASIDIHDPANKPALDALLAFQKKIAAKKLPFPKVRPDVGGVFPGSNGGTVVPPFDFAQVITTFGANVTNPTMSGSANNNGQISGSVATSFAPGFNTGSEFAWVGCWFHPPLNGILTISSAPTYSYWWSTNAINPSYGAISSVNIGLGIQGVKGKQVLVSTGAAHYSSEVVDLPGVHFKFGFDIQGSASVSLYVTPELDYRCFASVIAEATGVGWPGSLATAMASATVPSITCEFVPLIEP
jgi:hypothetical protein